MPGHCVSVALSWESSGKGLLCQYVVCASGCLFTYLSDCFSEIKQYSLGHCFLCYIHVEKNTESEVRLSVSLDCSMPHSFMSSDPRLNRHDHHRMIEVNN